jgi:hypothetical protein
MMNMSFAHQVNQQLGGSAQPLEESRYCTQALDNNYWQASCFDFTPGERPSIMPHSSFGKFYYPDFF